jgi:hypothetical protein
LNKEALDERIRNLEMIGARSRRSDEGVPERGLQRGLHFIVG